MTDCNDCEKSKQLTAELLATRTERDEWKRAAMEHFTESAKFEKKALSLEAKLAEYTATIERREIELESYKTQLENLKEEHGLD